MAQYEKVFTKPYEDGYENLPSQNTPITAQTLNDKDTAIEHIEDFLDGKEVLSTEEKTGLTDVVSDVALYERTGFLSKNLLPLNVSDIKSYNTTGTWSGNIYSINGGTIELLTQNDAVLGVKFNGVFTARSVLYIQPSSKKYTLPNNDYILSKGFTNASAGVIVEGHLVNTWVKSLANSSSNDNVSFTVDNVGYDRIQVYLFTQAQTLDNVIFYPMIRYATTENDSYTPYAPSNNALDAKKSDITAIGTDESGRTTASKAYAQGDIFYKDGFIGEALTAVASGATWTLNTNYKQTTLAEIVAALRA